MTIRDELYLISIDANLDMDIRYAAARQLQRSKDGRRILPKSDRPRREPKQLIIPPEVLAVIQLTKKRRERNRA